jgi:hypothetical protein
MSLLEEEAKKKTLVDLQDIISNTLIRPTIINKKSRFVVVTYWWGRGILNQNTSRPCISFFEKLVIQIRKLCVKTLMVPLRNVNGDIPSLDNLERIVPRLNEFTSIINRAATSYNNMIYDYLGILPNEANKDQNAAMQLEKLKSRNKVPSDFEYKNKEYAKQMFGAILIEVIFIIKQNCKDISEVSLIVEDLKNKFFSKTMEITPAEKAVYKTELTRLNNMIKAQKDSIKTKLYMKKNYTSADHTNPYLVEFNDMSIYQILHKVFRFLNPITYDEMIDKWNAECIKHACNHMAVEYPQFTQPGGYQMAINAKPLFIQKALEAVQDGGRSVVYIDGDMFVRKYPKIFDLPDVDYMARGWWMDPRSSYQMDESIIYDPYTFETSGGIMMFAQSVESKQLVSRWIEQASKSYQIGKADDRMVSLVFHTYKFLCSMNIIQLPIEYLWLSLDYDSRLLEQVYDNDTSKIYDMTDSIIIEHPECLTSEDTAVGGGAANDRTPKYYYLEGNLDPVSEQFHEYIMFPTKDMVETFRPYLNYMSGLQYINDNSEILIKKGFIHPNNPDDNEQPLYITKYDDKFGKFKYPEDDSLTYNDVAKINMQRSEKMISHNLNLKRPIGNDTNIIEINDLTKLMKEDDPTKYNNAVIISLIIKLLRQGNQVIYNPKSMLGYNKIYYDSLLKDRTEKLQLMNFIFVPAFTKGPTDSSNYFFKPLIQTNQVMMFRPTRILINFLMMFLSLDDMSSYLNRGSYEFMSRIRIGYLFNKDVKITAKRAIANVSSDASLPMLGGSSNDINTDIDLYNEGLDILYKGGGRRHRRPLHVKRRSFKKMTRKMQKGVKKSYKKAMSKMRRFKSKKYIRRASKKISKN